MVSGNDVQEAFDFADEAYANGELPWEEACEMEGIDADGAHDAVHNYMDKWTPDLTRLAPCSLILIGIRMGIYCGRKEQSSA